MEILKSMNKRIKKKNTFSRYYLFYIVMAIIFLIIVVRLLYLQIVMVDEYRETANSNSYKTVSVSAARGDIVDREGKQFATSIQSYVLKYSETEESDEYFFQTMTKVFEILDEKGIPQVDEFPIAIDENKNYSFKFQATSEESKKWLEIRFKKDRGFHEKVAKELYGEGTKMSSLSEEQLAKIDEELLNISAEEVFKKLETDYKLDQYYELTPAEKRRFLIVKDAIKMHSFSGDDPVVIANSLDEETAFLFEQLLANLPGIVVDTQPMRFYPEGELGSAFLGYMSSINPWEQEKYEEQGYDVSSDDIGVSGIEAAYEPYLKGSKGQQRIQINKQGRTVRVLGEVEAYAGDKVQLNIDMDIQKVAEKALDDTLKELQDLGEKSHDADTTNATRGAVVAIKNTGEILALASRPGFDPNVFTTPGLLTPELYQKYFEPNLEEMGKAYIKDRKLAYKTGILTASEVASLSVEEREALLLDRMFPLDKSIEGNTTIREDVYDVFPKYFYNYATLTLVPPGSTFKPVTALAGLEEGVIEKGTTINDNGIYGKYGFKGACWIYNMQHGSHGPITVSKALEVSCNYFFYDVADRLYNKYGQNSDALNLIAEYGWKLGLGLPQGSDLKASTGIEISENFGQIYNFESSKNTLTNIHVSNLVDYLSKGIHSKNAIKHYTPFDITQGDTTGKKGKELQQIEKTNEKKKILVDTIKAEMKAPERSEDAVLSAKLVGQIQDVINSDPAISDLGYTDQDIDNIAYAIIQTIIDAQTEIASPANAYSASIGQGLNAFTPLQLASYIATLVNGGTRYELKLVDKVIDSETGEVIKDITPEIISEAEFSPENIETVKEGMRDVTVGENGTSNAIFQGFPIPNGGKTGTSNIIQVEKQGAVGRDAAGVYVGFAPYDNPEIIVCTIIFDGGHGKGNITRAVFEEYFRERLLEMNPNYQFKYNPNETDTEK